MGEKMAAQKQHRTGTVPGMGAESSWDAPMSLRDTIPAPPLGPVVLTESGARRRRVTSVGLAPQSSPPASPPPASSPPISSAGRYSAQASHDDVVRIDEVGSTDIVAKQEASLVTKPR